tara:strand:+ start:2637 stop:3032 length:396 start_codon:yes stop_codon:yes gene_type:complete
MTPAAQDMSELDSKGPANRESVTQLRSVEPVDLPILFEFQLDEEANECAATNPRSKDEFDAHWTAILSDVKVSVRTILADNVVAGCISCFEADGDPVSAIGSEHRSGEKASPRRRYNFCYGKSLSGHCHRS